MLMKSNPKTKRIILTDNEIINLSDIKEDETTRKRKLSKVEQLGIPNIPNFLFFS